MNKNACFELASTVDMAVISATAFAVDKPYFPALTLLNTST